MKASHLLLLLFACHYSCAQVSQAPVSDSLDVPPGTVVVMGSITEISENTAVLNIHEVVGSGQGIINMLSAGQKVPVRLTGKTKLRPDEKIRIYLKEKLEADASRSSYEIVQIQRIKP